MKLLQPERASVLPRLIRTLSALVLFATLGFAQILSVYAAGVFFVSPAGNDANTCLTMASACRTIVSAVSKASSGDTIIIAAGVYTEGIGIGKDLTLIGFGSDSTIIDQGFVSVSGASVQIFDLAITNGNNPGGDAGLQNQGGNLSLNHTAILNGYGVHGGGIVNWMGTLTVDHITVAGNEAQRDGGGIDNEGGRVSVSYSNIYSNTTCNTNCIRAGVHAPGQRPATGFLSFSGGIYNYGLMTVTNSLISGMQPKTAAVVLRAAAR